MNVRPLSWAAGAAGAMLMSACAFGPGGAPPAMPSPAHYGVAPQPAQTVAAQGVAQQFVAGAPPVPHWWTLYRSDALNALVDEGLRNSPTLSAADHSLAAAREQLRGQIGQTLLPSVDTNGYAIRHNPLALPLPNLQSTNYNLFAGLVQARYTFDLFGANRLANLALASRYDEQAFQLDAARRALAANIVTAAIGAATLRDQIDATERLIALADDSAADARQSYALGALARPDLLSAEQNAASLAANLPALQQQYQATRHALAVLLGRTPDAAPPDLDLAAVVLPGQVPVVVPSELLKTRPDIQAAGAALQAAAAEVGAATAQMYPSISLSAAFGQAGAGWAMASSASGGLWAIGASLSQPVFHGGALRAQRRAALAVYDAANDQYRQTVLAAFQDVADRLAALEHDAAALDAADRAAASARGIYDATAARAQLGAVARTAVRSSEQQWQNARLAAIRYRGTRLTDTAALFQAMGTPPTAELPTDSGERPVNKLGTANASD